MIRHTKNRQTDRLTDKQSFLLYKIIFNNIRIEGTSVEIRGWVNTSRATVNEERTNICFLGRMDVTLIFKWLKLTDESFLPPGNIDRTNESSRNYKSAVFVFIHFNASSDHKFFFNYLKFVSLLVKVVEYQYRSFLFWNKHN